MSIPTIANDRFMLHGDTAELLYRKYAKEQPIIDYHCHLDPKQIAENKKFSSITELMLGGDHYKWRAMRSAGVPEELITGNGDDREKFVAYGATVANAPGNPLYHWTALELKKYFGIEEALTEESAGRIYDQILPDFRAGKYTAWSFIDASDVEVVCTTDDPADTLEYHAKIRASALKTKVYPTFRPDKCVAITKPAFVPYMNGIGVESYEELKGWLASRVGHFADNGCRLADHGFDALPVKTSADPVAVFEKALKGQALTDEEADGFSYDLWLFLAKIYAEKGWVMQVHVGAMRNNNTNLFRKLGADIGCDSIADTRLARALSGFLDELERTDQLPKTILYSLNPNDLYVLATLMGNFQKGPVQSKLQLGSAWWFCDQRDGMESQLKALANLGVLGAFVGMLTDSRSFVSYPRHDYFRRILCNLLGGWVDRGEYPFDEEMLSKIVRGICHDNAKRYFGF